MSESTKRQRKAKPVKLACCAVFRHTEAIWTFCGLGYGHTEPHADHRGNRWKRKWNSAAEFGNGSRAPRKSQHE